VPGSPRSHASAKETKSARHVHPAALLLACALVGAGLAFGRSVVDLAVISVVAAGFALRAEGRPLRAEAPLLALALTVFLAHALLSGRPTAEAAQAAALIALRLLALLYLLRWAARAFLGDAARWLLAFPVPPRPRILLLSAESARHAVALTPIALREAEQQHVALRARGLRPGRGASGRARYLAAWLLPFLGTMLRVGEAYGDALAARGYTMGARRRSGLQTAWGWPEIVVVAGGAASLAWLIRGA
jgi:energy-coupling factor transporter transmembrane protein EcfT